MVYFQKYILESRERYNKFLKGSQPKNYNIDVGRHAASCDNGRMVQC